MTPRGSVTGSTLALFVLTTSCRPVAPAVDRVADGTTERGRYVSHLSYAAYAQAAQFEALGELEAAERFYQHAMSYDPESWEIWTRLGAVRCALNRDDAKTAFSNAETLAPESASLWLAEARCEMSRENPDRALELAQRSLALDPDHHETTHLISEALAAKGRTAEARRWLVALRARHPGSPAAQIWLARVEPATSADPSSVRWVDLALLDGEAELASARALDLGISEAELAAREVALGLTEQGLERARGVLRADPADSSAWVVFVVAADLLGKHDEYERAIQNADLGLGPGDELSTLLLADLLKRRAGPRAARSWLEKTSAAPDGPVRPAPAGDELTARVKARLSAELASPSTP